MTTDEMKNISEMSAARAAARSAADRIAGVIPAHQIALDEPMAKHTSFRTGGPAAALVTVMNEDELAAVLGICAGVPALEYMLIGNGSNFIVADEGYDGIFIKLGGAFADISIMDRSAAGCNAENSDSNEDAGDAEEAGSKADTDTVLVRAGAARLLSSVSSFLTEHGLAGFEFASGIPGSVGGAVFMNAGAYGGEIRDIAVSVRMMRPDGSEIIELPAAEMDFSYRHSMAEDTGLIILSALFRFRSGDREEIAARVRELQEKRNAKQPVSFPSAGSTFKRPAGGFAAALIDEAGLKGYRVGGAMVSEKHAGFVINAGGATTGDVLSVMRHVRKTVYEQSGIMLEPEVRLIGCEL